MCGRASRDGVLTVEVFTDFSIELLKDVEMKERFANRCTERTERRATIESLERRSMLSASPVAHASAALPGGISGFVFNDANANTLQDATEANIPVQHVWLDTNHDGLWEPGEPAAVTDATGRYQFNNLANGNYVVRYYSPPGFHQTVPVAGPGTTINVQGSLVQNVNFGVTPNGTGITGQISGTVFNSSNNFPLPDQHVWIDLNHDGNWSPGEPAAVTDASGHYSFSNISGGSYTVTYYTPPGFFQTFPASTTQYSLIVDGNAISGVNFDVSGLQVGGN